MNNYEKKNEEIVRATQLWENGDITREQLEYIFPELKESESKDEKVRKEIIEMLRNWASVHYITKKQFSERMDWLEKHGEIDLEHYKDGENEKRKFVGYGFLKCKGDFLSFKEGETYWLEYVGNDNYNVRSDNLLDQTFHIKPVELYTVFRPTTWLEKQGDKLLNDTDEDIVEAVKNISTLDLVGPKFHESDWVVHIATGIVHQIKSLIENVTNKTYGYDLIDGGYISSDDEVNYRLWTIKDAKDGDVLANDYHILILKELVYDWSSNGTPYSVKAYCGIKSNGNFEIGKDNWCFCDTLHIHPANKEQRNAFFAKMKEAGYAFDFEKKELNKIHVIDEGKAEMDYCFTKMMNGRNMNLCSKDDEIEFNHILKILTSVAKEQEIKGYNNLISSINWLKSMNNSQKEKDLDDINNEQEIAEANNFCCSDIAEHNETGLGCFGCDEMLKRGAQFFRDKLWRDASKELPTKIGEDVLCICRNKNKPDGIWLLDLIVWEGSWEGRINYEKVQYWAYASDIMPDYHFGMR